MKKCLNPKCQHNFEAGHYGELQKVCGRRECKKWYKRYWSEVRKPPRGIPSNIMRAILHLVEKDDPILHALLIVARESALRKGELLGLTWRDVLDHENQVKSSVAVRGQWDDKRGFVETKTGASKLGLLTTAARDAIRSIWNRYRKVKPKLDDRIFPFWESSVWKWFRDLQCDLGVSNPETGRPYRFHDMRHSVGVELVRAGKIQTAQKMLNHKSVNTTMGYAERSAEELLGEVEEVRRRKRR